MNIQKNFLDDDLYNTLNKFIFAETTPWYKKYRTTYNGKPDITWFSHSFYDDNCPKSDVYELILPILNKLNCRSPINIRANLVLKTYEHIITNWHTDTNYNDAKTSILYINDCNGATIFKNNDNRVTSESNKMLTFESLNEHATLTQTDKEERIVINFNYF